LLELYNLFPPRVSRKRQVPMILPNAWLAGATSFGTLMAASHASPERRAALYERFRWCDRCGTSFEIYPPSVAIPSADDKGGLGIL
jgi:hypothetical protein